MHPRLVPKIQSWNTTLTHIVFYLSELDCNNQRTQYRCWDINLYHRYYFLRTNLCLEMHNNQCNQIEYKTPSGFYMSCTTIIFNGGAMLQRTQCIYYYEWSFYGFQETSLNNYLFLQNTEWSSSQHGSRNEHPLSNDKQLATYDFLAWKVSINTG